MRKSLFDKRIPTLFAIFLLLGGVGIASYLARSTLKLTSSASPDETPQNMRITNIKESSFTVTYTTSKAVLGTISYGTATPDQTALDERDTGTPKQYTEHSIVVKGLKPSTPYTFSILSGGSTFFNDGKLFTAMTAPHIEGGGTKQKITGTILKADSTKASGVLVYITAKNLQVLSTLTRNDGTYIFPLDEMRTSTLTEYAGLTDDTTLQIAAVSNASSSNASFLLQDPSVPPLTLSQNYDFTLGREILLPQTGSDSASVSFPVLDAKPTESTPVTIETPENNEKFSDAQPKFEGTAGANEDVEITIRSEEKKVTVRSDSNGNWAYRPDTPLEPGEHTISINTKDSKGILRQITRTFIVQAEGSQFTEPSVSPVKSPTPSVSSSPTPSTATVTPTDTPTMTPSPTLATEVTPSPTDSIVIPTTEPSPTVSPRPTIQPTGSGDFNAVGLISFALMISGVILFIFTKGISL